MKDTIYKIAPHFIQNLMISIFNYKAYKVRYGGNYWKYREEIKERSAMGLDQLREYQKKRYQILVEHAIKSSNFYKRTVSSIAGAANIDNIRQLPIITKEILRRSIEEVYTVSKNKGVVSKTGGTTGKSLEVIFTKDNMQERFAMLDDFRARFGYELGKRTAWFSGKDLLTAGDIKKKRFWKTDIFHKVRYYSTFHIREDYLKHYVDDLTKFSPEYLVGFPSSIMEVAKYGLANKFSFPAQTVKAIFPTAETITHEMREVIETFFKTKMYDQYASSEGAPFIFECARGNLHLELQSGVFEVLDENNQPTNSGRLVLTSFTTDGTPLIRYDIGDSISLADEGKTCSCGNHNPLVIEVLGRIDDYIYSPENGKINLGNVSNTLKDTKGIVRFQAVQDELNKIQLFVVKDNITFDKLSEAKFIKNWRDRIGDAMELKIEYVDKIPVEKSGKFRIVKNNIKHLIL
ncbi:phenylacetate--CoA ligase family protein [Olivibacter sp. LS-1]|uniref:phenylacetate--CoA ligase family protein n=1 Tax=unclassified Olivibacter TaxID=2632301 RepID=UPI0011EB367B|nr:MULTISPECIES: phenylacetate--CoA ligase family protein [unclassified Olivibacter]MDM8177223.1 phenylacetate--CoA ligase family protein [Olivibacter sp. 47]QEL00379.1 phenylacetate--CoA ligase family protein [Olivibacter sp. LS-1]